MRGVLESTSYSTCMTDLCMCRVQVSMAVEDVCVLHGKDQLVPRPAVPDWDEIPTVKGETREAAHAALVAQNNICTCAAGVPSFLCRVRACWGLEIGTCEPKIEASRGGTLFHAKRCQCIRWDLITDDGRLKVQRARHAVPLRWGVHLALQGHQRRER